MKFSFSEGHLHAELLSGKRAGSIDVDVTAMLRTGESIGVHGGSTEQVKMIRIYWEVAEDASKRNKHLIIHGHPRSPKSIGGNKPLVYRK